MLIIKQDLANHATQPVLFVDEGTPDKERTTLSGGTASVEILTGAYEGLQITDTNGVVKRVKTSEITSTRILPAAAVPFAGTTTQLKDLLVADFFFDIATSSGGGNIFDSFGLTGGYFQSQGVETGPIISSSIHLSNSQFAVSLSLNGSYAEFSMLKRAGAVSGDTTFAIYDSGADGFPNQKIWQSAEFAVTGVAELLQNSFSPAINFSAGTYWFSWHGNAAFTWAGMAELGKMGMSLSGTTLSVIRRIFSVVPYATLLPDVWVASINNSLAGTPPMLLQKRKI